MSDFTEKRSGRFEKLVCVLECEHCNWSGTYRSGYRISARTRAAFAANAHFRFKHHQENPDVRVVIKP